MSEAVAVKSMSRDFFKLEDQILTEEHLKRAKEELGETPEIRKTCLEELKSLIMEERNLNALTDENFLLRFLRVRKFDVGKAFKQLKIYYMQQKRYPTVFSHIPSRTLASFIENKVFDILPFRNTDGSAILVYRPCFYDPCSVSFDSIIRSVAIGCDWFLENPLTQIYGLILLVNAENMTMHHIFSVTPSNAYCLLKLFQDNFPFRFKGIHVINESKIFSILHNVLKLFLSKKLKSRMLLHGSDMQSLHKFIPPAILSEEFGGDLGPFDNSKTLRMLCQHEKKFIENLKFGYFNK